MKYFMQLALVALLLFSVSAALSLWLNQSKQPVAEKEAADKPAKKGGKDADASEKPKDGKTPKYDTPGLTDVSPGGAMSAVRDREDRLERRQAQMDLILRDLQAEREAVDALQRTLTTETKAAAIRATEVEAKAVTPPKTLLIEPDPAGEKKNIDQLARLYDAMAPESAAPILKQMADSGRMDTAVRILAQMRDRQAAQVLAAFADPSLAAQLTDRVRALRRLPATGATSNVAPATAPLPAPAPVRTP